MVIRISSSTDIDFLTTMINQETKEFGDACSFAFCIPSEDSRIIAGCNGSIIYGSIYTDQLWVHPDHRKRGLGQRLMNHVHDHGRKQGCTMATVNTMGFQNAEKFYQKLGYEVDFIRHGYINNSHYLFLKKML